LLDGDTVEILTNSQQFPRKDWLDFVASSRARNRIRHSIHYAENERARQLGRDILERELRRAKLSLKRLLESGELEEFARSELRTGGTENLFSAVGYGKLSASSIVRKLQGESAESDEKGEAPQPIPRRLRSLFRRQRREPERTGILVSGLPDVMVRYAGCCAPLPGDEVVGFVTRGRGVTIHQNSCPRVFELDSERRIDVQWQEGTGVPRKIKIRVSSIDQPGILAKVTNSISAAGINIGAAAITTAEAENAVQTFTLWVTDVTMLNAVMKEIERVKGVISVERVRSGARQPG
jgi:GTP pyrophosphokinase